MEEYMNLTIGPDEKLALDGLELKNVTDYALKHSATEMAELTITMVVSVNKANHEQTSLEERLAEIERQIYGMEINVDAIRLQEGLNAMGKRQGYDFKRE